MTSNIQGRRKIKLKILENKDSMKNMCSDVYDSPNPVG